jgi:hypothetical protein
MENIRETVFPSLPGGVMAGDDSSSVERS